MSNSAKLSPEKFDFATEFGTPRANHAEDVERLQQEVREAERRGYENGRNDASVIATAQLTDAIERLGARAQIVLDTLDTERAQIEKEALELAVITAKTLAQQLLAKEPVGAINQLAASCLDSLRKSPHIVFRVNPDLVEKVEERLKKLSFERGFEGRLIVMGDPDMAQGDCKIEWADGGFERNAATLTKKIEEAVSRYLETQHAPDGGTR